jgi:hypothetical protein
VIVVVGNVAYQPDPATGRAAGLAAEIAVAAAATGASVEILARIGEDGAGEELLLALARAGVGHLAILRDPARPTALVPVAADAPDGTDDDPVGALLADVGAAALRPTDGREAGNPNLGTPVLEPADISLGLRYLREFGVLVAVEPVADGAAAVIADAAAFAGATLVVVAPPGVPVPEAYALATVLEAPTEDPEGAFARLVGGYAAALDRGMEPGEAFRAAAEGGGWQVASD